MKTRVIIDIESESFLTGLSIADILLKLGNIAGGQDAMRIKTEYDCEYNGNMKVVMNTKEKAGYTNSKWKIATDEIVEVV